MQTKMIRRAAIAATLAAASGGALAAPCDVVLSNYDSAFSVGDSVNAGDLLSNFPECFPGGATNSVAQIHGTSFQQVAAISQALQTRWASDAPGPRASMDLRGMAAGGAPKRWNIWGNLSNNDTRQNYTSISGNSVHNDTDILNTVLGVDYGLSPGMVFGASLAFDKGNGQGTNSGAPDVNNLDSDGYMLAPYFGMQLSKEWSFDVSAGFGTGKTKTNAATEAEADRWFAAANLNYERWSGNWQFSGKASLMHGEEDYENAKTAGVENLGTGARNKIDQLRLGVQVGYWMNGVMPYATIGYTTDINRKTNAFGAPSDPIGDDAWLWGLGVNFFSLAGGINGGIAYRQEEGRNNQKNWNLMLNVGFRF